MSYGDARVYKKVEVIGTSSESVESAIQTAVDRARDSLDQLSW
ncbi:MAG: dodecin flavoprotein, partial [Aliifodinibius sp.]|nr:dodecin flavoprotein [Fodinibius sp.]